MISKLFLGVVTTAFWMALLRCLGGFMCAVVVLGCAWYFLGPDKPEASETQQMVANRAIYRIINDLRKNRGDIKRVSVMHFTNDVSDYVTLTLRGELSMAGTFDVEDTSFQEKLNNMLSLRNKGCFSIEQAWKYGKENELDAVIIGSIDRFEHLDEKNVVLTGNVKMLDIRTQQTVADITINESSYSIFSSKLQEAVSLPQELRKETEQIPWALRVLLFILLVLLLPLVTFAFIRFMVAKRSNKHNAFVLVTYTILDAILAFFMIGGRVDSVGILIGFLLAVLVAFLYNTYLMNFASKLEAQ